MTKSDGMFTGNELPRGRSLALFLVALLCGAIACGALSSVGDFPRHWDIRTQLQKQYEIYYLATCVNSSTKAGIPIQMRAMCDEAHITMRQSPLVRAMIDTLDTLNIFKEGYAFYLVRNLIVTTMIPLAIAAFAVYLLYDAIGRIGGTFARSNLPALLPEQLPAAKKLQ